MPEGDTIHRTAAALRSALLGKPMTAFEAPRLTGVRPGVGSVIERVESWGKHLEIGFDDGIVLHTHMRMSGSWHLYHPGQRWRKSARAARVVIEVPGWQAVCFSAPVVDTYRTKELTRHPLAGSLGPDLCRPDTDLDECVSRIEGYVDDGATVADVLLDQRIACGVGNVYKSEVLWAVGLHPLSTIGCIDADGRRALIDTAARLLRANLSRPDRTTHGSGLAVYGRTGKPCPRCGTPIEVARHGEQARVTYWCPGCQERRQPVVEPVVEPVGDEPALEVVDDGDAEVAYDDGWHDDGVRPYEIPRPWRDPRPGAPMPRARLAVLEDYDEYDRYDDGDEVDDGYDPPLDRPAERADPPFVPLLPADLRDDPYAVDPWADPWDDDGEGADDADGWSDGADEEPPPPAPVGRERSPARARVPIDPLL